MNPAIDDGEEVVRARSGAQLGLRIGSIVVLLVALGVLLRLYAFPWVLKYLASASRFEVAARTQNVLDVLAALLALGGMLALWHGIRIVRAGRWPLRGAFVVKDTLVRRGRAAKGRAFAFGLLGLVQIGLAAGAWVLPRYFIYQQIPAF